MFNLPEVDAVTSNVKAALRYVGLCPDRTETYVEHSEHAVVTYATFKFKFDKVELLTKSSMEVIAAQTKNFSDNILASRMVVTELRNLTETIDAQKLEITRLQEEVQRLNKFEQHFNVEKALKHNLELK
jgi:hypothetical protein